ncbi:putative haloacid dehalogenase-like hydrolase [Actinoplanes missouriensis 431]|uniref:Putative haloacid dehalogenase-like hydrolase n=1 Tax=Actinoplanes missouriensis (strain ATCC 14538 / DSM 43046 / CBS 188.64 / JCM 3121 / NBRC 102363 / NCIMB 12654 / NRRL B-3342 / UNCC 431) TaxID=512565 RepID=I0H5Z9_ACTM4|nr:HAD-IA family hydrolase [Actinoplanes missouriensis]BAL88436.1 putative haloacid dehalogenase-like hydrolase [Actinoplanes missouriensis 431]
MTVNGTILHAAAVLFDLDGVLVDSGATVERSWRRWAVRQGLDPAAVLAVCHGRTTAATIAVVAGHLDAAAEARRIESEQAADSAEVRACPGAADLIAEMPAGRWAVVTSGSRALASSRLRQASIPVPDVLITSDDVRRGKPDAEGYRAAAGLLGVEPSDCVVIEDAHPGVTAALAAGCRVIGIAGPALGPTEDVDVLVGDLAAVTATATAAGAGVDLRPRAGARW